MSVTKVILYVYKVCMCKGKIRKLNTLYRFYELESIRTYVI